MNLQRAGASLERRADLAVRELLSCIIDGSAVGGHDGARRSRCGTDRVVLLARHDAAQTRVARFLGFGIQQLRFIAGEDRLRLTQCRLIRVRIDREEQLTAMDFIAFSEPDVCQLTGDERPDLSAAPACSTYRSIGVAPNLTLEETPHADVAFLDGAA